jgi:hypothetical protein
MSAIGWTLSLLLGLVFLVVGRVLLDLATKEIHGRLDQLPFLILRIARWRLPVELRQAVHDEWWLPDLCYLIERETNRPITRLIRGTSFACSQVIHARQTAREAGKLTVLARTRRVISALYADGALASALIGIQSSAGFTTTVVLVGSRFAPPGAYILEILVALGIIGVLLTTLVRSRWRRLVRAARQAWRANGRTGD